MKAIAIETGGKPFPECGDDWVRFLPFRGDYPKIDFDFWALKAYRQRARIHGIGLIRQNINLEIFRPCESGVALRFPPHSKIFSSFRCPPVPSQWRRWPRCRGASRRFNHRQRGFRVANAAGGLDPELRADGFAHQFYICHRRAAGAEAGGGFDEARSAFNHELAGANFFPPG